MRERWHSSNMSTPFREVLFGLEEVPGVRKLAAHVVDERVVLVDGRLQRLGEDEDELCEVDLGSIAYDLPFHLRQALEARYGSGLDERQLNLLESGAELAVATMRKWVQLEGVWDPETSEMLPPLPPPGF